MSRAITTEYCHSALAGCVDQRVSRQTGLKVGLYHAEQAGLDAGPGPWVTVCEEHGCIVSHATLQLARAHAADPLGWCEACRDMPANRQATKTEAPLDQTSKDDET